MSLVKNGMLVFPLKQQRVTVGERTVYDRSTRGKSWFILDLALPGGRFIPSGSEGLLTSEGEAFTVTSRHKER